jgi:hypothetical protein
VLLDVLELRLAALGFTRTGPPEPRSSFTKRTRDGLAVVHVQRSWTSERNLLRVTANLSASLDVLDRFGAVTWSSRIGHVLPAGNDQWWEIRRDHFEDDSRPMLDAVVTVGAPEAVRRASIEVMRTIWAGGPSNPFEDEFHRYFGLALLHRTAGDREQADVALEHAAVAAAHSAIPARAAAVKRLRGLFSDPAWRPT